MGEAEDRVRRLPACAMPRRDREDAGGLRPAGAGLVRGQPARRAGVRDAGARVVHPFESPRRAAFEDFGINVHHAAAGRAVDALPRRARAGGLPGARRRVLAIIEEQERPLRHWDFLHCPAGHRPRLRRRGRRAVRDPDGRLARGRTATTLPGERGGRAARRSRRRSRPTTARGLRARGLAREQLPAPMPWPDWRPGRSAS